MKGGGKDPLGDIIEALIDYMSNQGTVLIPLFNFEYCKTGFFDYKNTSSAMGALTERARYDPRFKRTAHQICSFAV